MATDKQWNDLWIRMLNESDKPTTIVLSPEGWLWAQREAKRLGLVRIKNPKVGGKVFRKKRKTDAGR